MPNFYNLLRARKFSTAADTAVEIAPYNSATPNFVIEAGGKLKWSSGSATADTVLYRSAADVLKTDDSFDIASGKTYKIDGTDTLTSSAVLGSSTAPSIGNATSATLTINPGTVVGANTTQNVFNTVATTVNAFGESTATTVGAATGTFTVNSVTLANPNATSLTMNGASPSITTSSTGTASVFNANALTGSLFGEASTINIGNTITAAQTFNLGTASTGASTYNFATGATGSATTKTINLGTGGAASSTTNVNIGSSNGGTTTINSSTVVGAAATQNVFNTVATTVNAFGAATAVSIGATTGTTTVNNGIVLKQVLETATIDSSTNLSATRANIDVLTSSVYLFSGTPSADFTLNIRGNSSVTDLNTLMATGQTLTVSIIVSRASNVKKLSVIEINQVSQTINWFGGSAPTTGNALDIYTITILKTAASTYTVFASQAKFA